MLRREEQTAFPWGSAEMKHLQNSINYQKRMICFQKHLMLLFCVCRKLLSFWRRRAAASKVCLQLLLAACASPCCREPLKGFQVAQGSIFPFQLLHPANWRKWQLVPTSSSGIYCSKEKKASKSRLAELQPNYSYSSAGFPKKTGKRGSKAAFVPLCPNNCSVLYKVVKESLPAFNWKIWP